MKTLFRLSVLALLLLAAGCQKDSNVLLKDYPYLVQDEVSEITNAGITARAEVISSGSYSTEDYGFVLGTHAKPVLTDRKISMKSMQENPGILTLRIDNDLASDQQYFIRAYIQTKSMLVYSNEQTFTSMGCVPPRIDRLSAYSGIPGNVVTIAGNYFSETRGHNIVRFGNEQAAILYEDKDTIIVQCPNTKGTKQVIVTVEAAGHTGSANSMFNLQNPWTPMADFPGGARFWSTYFTVGANGYVTLGKLGMNSFAPNDLWEFNSETNQWQALPAFPGVSREEAIGFTIGSSGYIGLGAGDNGATYSDMWEYNSLAGSWTKKADFPGSTYWYGTFPHFVIDGKFYIFTRYNNDEFWMYDPVPDQWLKLPTDNQLKTHTMTDGFSIGNTGYFMEQSGSTYGPKTLHFWQYDPVQNNVFKTDSVLTTSWYIEGFSFNIGRKIFISARDQCLIEYDMDSGLLFNHVHPSGYDNFNFSLVFGNRAIVNTIETATVVEFNTTVLPGYRQNNNPF